RKEVASSRKLERSTFKIECEQVKKARKTTISPDWMLKASGREFVVYRGFPANTFWLCCLLSLASSWRAVLDSVAQPLKLLNRKLTNRLTKLSFVSLFFCIQR
ncbi:hypothetical protein HMPREF0549_1334, partial [Limosilactobacillus vaginalis DSM 5837 = ATCC 49540]